MEWVEDGALNTVLAAVVICAVESLANNIPATSLRARKLRNVATAVSELAAIHALPVTDAMTNVGVEAWNACAEIIERGLSEILEDFDGAQLMLFGVTADGFEYFEHYRDVA